MDLLVAFAWSIAVSAGVVWLERRRRALPPWTDFEETRISPDLWNIEGTVRGCGVKAAVVRGLERSFCNVRIDVSSLLHERWSFNANLRTGKVWTQMEGRTFVIHPGSNPAIRDDIHVEIRGGVAELELRSRGDPREIHAAALELLRLIEQLAWMVRPEELAECFRLEDTALYEQEKLLLLLAALHPEHPLTSEIVELAARSEEPVLELAAAKHLTDERKSRLLFRVVEKDHAYDSVRAEALSLLEPFLDPARAQEIALRILRGSPSLARRAAIRLLAEFPPAEAPERLLEIAHHVQHLGTAIELVNTLSKIGGEKSTRALEHLLAFPNVQQETLAALARLGDRRTLGAIHEHLETLHRAGLREATDRAIEEIRKRLGAPDGGRLSLAHPTQIGELSLSEE